MNKKFILLGIVLILLSSFVYADEQTDLYDNGILYYSLEETGFNYVDRYGNLNLITGNAPDRVAGVVDYGQNYELTNTDYTKTSNSALIEVTNPIISAWINIESDTTQYLLNTFHSSGGNFYGIASYYNAGTNAIVVQAQSGTGSTGDIWSTSALNLATDYHLFISYNDNTGDLLVCINGVSSGSETTEGTSHIGYDTGNMPFTIGTYDASGSPAGTYIDATIDEVYYGDFAVTDCSYALWLYNSGSGRSWIDINPAGAIYTQQSTAKNIYSNNAINNFNVSYTNATDTYIVSTTNGTIFFNYNEKSLYNVVFQSEEYFNYSLSNYNLTTNINAQLYQSKVIVYAQERITNDTITIFNSTIGNSTNTSNNVQTHYIDSGDWFVKGRALGFNFTQNLTIENRETKTLYLGFGDTSLNITAKDFFTNITVSNFSVDFYYFDNNSKESWLIESVLSENGFVYFPTIEGLYNITLGSNIYASVEDNINLTTGTSKLYYLYTTNSILFNFYDEVTRELLTGRNITLELISDADFGTYRTTTGSKFLSLLSPSTYTIRTSCSGYDERFYEYTLLDDSNININIYLVALNTTDFSSVALTVLDQDRKAVENALVKVLRYNVDSNTYDVREMVRTNFEGQAEVDLIKNSEFYKFIIIYNGVQELETAKTQIYADSLTFQIIIGNIVLENFFTTNNVETSLIFLNSTNQFRYYFNDNNNLITKGCLVTTKTTVNTTTAYNTTCASGTSGIIYSPVKAENGTTYTATAFIYIGDTERFVDQLKQSWNDTVNWGNMGWFGVLLLTILLSLTGLYSITVALILTPLPLLLFSIIGIINFNPAFAIGLEIIMLIVGLVLEK